MVENILIPKIRQDLKLHKGPYEADGSPTWLLYDPIADDYYKLGWFEFECLKRFDSASDLDSLVKVLKEKTTFNPTRDDIFDLVSFLVSSNLCQPNDPLVQKYQMIKTNTAEPPSLLSLFSKYIFFQIPLFAPEPFLKCLFPFVRVFLGRFFFILMVFVFFAGMFLTFQKWDVFLGSASEFYNANNIVLILLSTILVKSIHEFAHAFVAHKHNVPVTSLGVAFIICYPILYTETTNSWRLFDRWKRIEITISGVLAEWYLAAIALVFWHILPPGSLQNTAFFVAVISFVASVFINGNPLMKFDGYYLLSDVVAIDNLQHRAIEFLKWKVRSLLFFSVLEPPEYLDEKTEKFLTVFGFALASYRFFLYLGIALIMYSFVPRPFGLIFAVLEIYIFIITPLLKELRVWSDEKYMLIKNKKPKLPFILSLVLLIVLFLPIDTKILVPGVFHASGYSSVYSSIEAKIEKVHVENGDWVEKGDVLFELSSSFLEKEIRKTLNQIKLYEAIEKRELHITSNNDSYGLVFKEKITEARVTLEGLLKQKRDLYVSAENSGYVRDISDYIHSGRWLNKNILLARVINDTKFDVTAYISERDILRVSEGAEGYFRFPSSHNGPVSIRLNSDLDHNTQVIDHPELSSLYGGVISSHKSNTGEVLSSETMYVVNFSVEEEVLQNTQISKPGFVVLNASAQIPIVIFFQNFLSLFVQGVNI